MNRFQRRASAALERKDIKGGEHQTRSFQDLVGQANRDALKPFIVECMGELETLIRQDIARLNIDALSPVQTRLTALEKLVIEKLDETPDSLAKRYLDAEDEATGHVATEEPAEKGDLLRVTWQLKVEGQPKWSKPAGIVIYKLAQLRPHPETGELVYQTYGDLETALIGAKVGETRETEVEIANGEVKVKYTFKVTVDRVSRNTHERAIEAARAKAIADAQAKAAAEQESAPVSEAPPAEATNG